MFYNKKGKKLIGNSSSCIFIESKSGTQIPKLYFIPPQNTDKQFHFHHHIPKLQNFVYKNPGKQKTSKVLVSKCRENTERNLYETLKISSTMLIA